MCTAAANGAVDDGSVDTTPPRSRSPESAVFGGRPSSDDLGDEDPGVVSDVGVVCAAGNAEA